MSGAAAIPPLRPGDWIGLASPAAPLEAAVVASGEREIRRLGYRLRRVGPARPRRGYLAGDDAARAAELNALFADPEVRAILFARGGYGTARLLPRLDLEGLRRSPRLLVGFSDLTALFAALQAGGDYPVGYGPNLADLARPSRYHAASFRRFLAEGPGGERLALSGCRTLVPGRAEGMLLGGCLTLLQTLVGTPWQPRFEGALLFLEDWREEPYRVDRMLLHLRQAGMLRGIRALLFGRPVAMRPRRGQPSLTLEEILLDHAGDLGVPVVTGLPVGHCARKVTLSLGVPARLDTAAGLLETLAPPSGGRAVALSAPG
jgi:muramoyltetrapeptide carboxypeptidase